MAHLKTYILIAFLVLFTTFLVWLPFIFNYPIWGIKVPSMGLGTVVTNYDGPYYIAIAKSLYKADILKTFEFPLTIEYYAAHFPLYPLVIRAIANFTNYPYAMLISTVGFMVASAIMFYRLALLLRLPSPLFLTLVLLFLPARLLIARTVGTPEPQFMFFALWSIYAFLRKKYFWAGIAGALLVATKPPGILMFGAMGLALIHDYLSELKHDPNRKWYQLPFNAWPLLLLPLSLVAVFAFYARQYGTFWAYFQSGDNIHLFWPPFQVFNQAAFWVGTFWLEDIIWLFLLFAVSLGLLFQNQRNVIFYYVLIFFASLCFVEHRDISRYSLPLAPLVIIAFGPYLNHPAFKRAFIFLIIPIYLFAINFIANNTTPISDWTQLL